MTEAEPSFESPAPEAEGGGAPPEADHGPLAAEIEGRLVGERWVLGIYRDALVFRPEDGRPSVIVPRRDFVERVTFGLLGLKRVSLAVRDERRVAVTFPPELVGHLQRWAGPAVWGTMGKQAARAGWWIAGLIGVQVMTINARLEIGGSVLDAVLSYGGGAALIAGGLLGRFSGHPGSFLLRSLGWALVVALGTHNVIQGVAPTWTLALSALLALSILRNYRNFTVFSNSSDGDAVSE